MSFSLALFHKLVEERVEVFVESFHQVTVDDDGLVVSHIQLGDVLAVVVLQCEAVRLQYSEIVYGVAHPLEDVSQQGGDFLIEIVVLVVYPLFHHAPRYFLVIVIKSQQLATVL